MNKEQYYKSNNNDAYKDLLHELDNIGKEPDGESLSESIDSEELISDNLPRTSKSKYTKKKYVYKKKKKGSRKNRRK